MRKGIGSLPRKFPLNEIEFKGKLKTKPGFSNDLMKLPRFGYGGDVEGGADQGVNGSDTRDTGGLSMDGASTHDIANEAGFANGSVYDGGGNGGGDQGGLMGYGDRDFGSTYGDTWGGFNIGDVTLSPDTYNSIGQQLGESAGGGGLFGMGLDATAATNAATTSAAIDAFGYDPSAPGTFATSLSGIQTAPDAVMPSLQDVNPFGAQVEEGLKPTAALPSMVGLADVFPDDSLYANPDYQGPLHTNKDYAISLDPRTTVNFSMDPYDNRSLARPDVRVANAVGLTENRRALARGDLASFQAPIDNVYNRALVNYDDFGPTIKDQAYAKGQYAGMHRGNIRGAMSNDELNRQGYGIAKGVLSGELPDVTNGAMSFGSGHRGLSMEVRDPTAQNFAGNVFGNWNSQERDLAEQAREARLGSGTAVAAASFPDAPPETVTGYENMEAFPSTTAYEDPLDKLDREYGGKAFSSPPDYAAMDREYGSKAPSARTGLHDQQFDDSYYDGFSNYDSERGRKSFSSPSLPASGFHLGTDELPTTEDQTAFNQARGNLAAGLDARAYNIDREVNRASNYATSVAPDFDRMAATLNQQYGAQQPPAPATNPVAAVGSIPTPQAPQQPQSQPRPAAVRTPSPELSLPQTAPLPPARPTEQQAAAQPSFVGKALELGTNLGVSLIPGVGLMNTAMGLAGGLMTGKGLFNGPTIGSAVRSLYENGVPKNSPMEAFPSYYGGESYGSRPAPPSTEDAQQPNNVSVSSPSMVAFDPDMFYGPGYDQYMSRLRGS